MATLQQTKYQNWRIQSQGLYKNEFERGMYGALDFFVSQNSVANAIVSPELLRRALGSIGNTIQIPVLKTNADATVGNARTCVAPDNGVDSALVNLTWVTLTDGFIIVPNFDMSNEIKYDQLLRANMLDMCRRLAAAINTLCEQKLESDKTTIVTDPLNYTVTGGVVEAAWNDRDYLMGDLGAMQMANGFFGGLNLIGNAGTLNIVRRLYEQGTYNDRNKSWQYADKSLFVTGLTNAASQYATFFAVPDGQVAILSRVSRPEYRGDNVNEHSWGTTELPFMRGITFGTHFYRTVGDMSQLTGNADQVCDYADHYQFSVDIALLTAYNSRPTTAPSPVLKGQIASGSNAAMDVNVVSMPA